MRTIIVGDIHGCYTELTMLLDKVSFDRSKDRVVFVGDYADRGSQSYEVWKYLEQLKATLGDRCVLLWGNHELMATEYLKGIDRAWGVNGAVDTIQSFSKHGDWRELLKEYASFLNKNLEPYYLCADFQVCHAGTYCEDLSTQELYDLVWDRTPFRCGGYTGKLTFVGHTVISAPFLSSLFSQPISYDYRQKYDLPTSGLLGIDTGCTYGYSLTACVVQNKTMRFYKVSKL